MLGLRIAGSRSVVLMFPWPSVAWTSGRLAPPSIACEPWAWRSQCGETSGLMPALMAARLIMPVHRCSMSLPPPLRLAKTGSLAPASPQGQQGADQLPGGARR